MIIVTEWWIKLLYNDIIIAMHLKQYLIKDHGRNGIIWIPKILVCYQLRYNNIIFREWIFLHKIFFFLQTLILLNNIFMFAGGRMFLLVWAYAWTLRNKFRSIYGHSSLCRVLWCLVRGMQRWPYVCWELGRACISQSQCWFHIILPSKFNLSYIPRGVWRW